MSSTTAVPEPRTGLGPIRETHAGTSSFPHFAHAYTELSQSVRDRGLLRRTPWFYALVGTVLLLGLGGCITGFILLGDSWFQLLMAAGLGILFTQAAFIAHEAAHRQVFASGRANDRLARIVGGVVGMSYSWWDSKHTRHHGNPNRVDRDPDIGADTIAFIPEDAASARGLRRLIVGRQGWLFFPLLTLEGLNLHFLSIKYLASRQEIKGRWIEIGIIAARFAVLVVPLFLFLPLGMAFAFLGVELAVFGVYMGASFAPNHTGMPTIAHDAKLDFFTKQVRTSRNISGGWWATWVYGGLNYQVEHHLFPNMPRPHLAKARTLVREQCRTLDVPYTEVTLPHAYAAVLSYLNRVGLAARDPFACPMVAEYRRV